MTTRTSGVVRLLMALVVATACGSGPSTVATTNPTPATVLDDHFGFIAGNTVRVESSAGASDFVSETVTLKRTSAGAANLYILSASQNGKHVFGHGDPNNVVRVWPMDSYEGGVELRGTSDEHVATVAWRPGTAEVGVLFHGDRLELWDANGAKRTIALPAAKSSSDRYATLAFRADGKAVVISRQSGVEGSTETYTVAVDLASGRSVL